MAFVYDGERSGNASFYINGHLAFREWPTRVVHAQSILADEMPPRGGFIHAETLVQNGTAGDNTTAGGTLNQPVQSLLQG